MIIDKDDIIPTGRYSGLPVSMKWDSKVYYHSHGPVAWIEQNSEGTFSSGMRNEVVLDRRKSSRYHKDRH